VRFSPRRRTPHCGAFHRDTFADFRTQYIDTGKVRFIFREFPLDAAAFAVAMIARCAPADKYFDIVGAYFDRQTECRMAAERQQAHHFPGCQGLWIHAAKL
jgi:protein-disulfide isomerase